MLWFFFLLLFACSVRFLFVLNFVSINPRNCVILQVDAGPTLTVTPDNPQI